MKAKVKKPLNERGGKPSVNAPNDNFYNPGDLLEIIDIVNGDTIDNNSLWFKLNNGKYVWSGGVEGVVDVDIKENLNNMENEKIDQWWIDDYGIPEIWKKGITGKGVKIAIIDTGINLSHKDLNINENNCFDVSESISSFTDQNGHGTHCAGIINAINNGTGITGVAYDAEIFPIKIENDDFGGDLSLVEKAINKAIEQNVNIISISFGRPDEEKDIEESIIKAVENNIFVVVSGGNKLENENTANLMYPACYESSFSVGAIDKSRNIIPETILSEELNILAPGKDIKSTWLNNTYKLKTGTSQATPYVAGVFALALEAQKNKKGTFEISIIKELLVQTATKYKDTNYKIINPKLLINTILS